MKLLLDDPAAILPGSWVAGDRVVTGAELGRLVSERARLLPDSLDGRCLVHVRMERTLDAIIGYLAVLEAGHVALVLGPGQPGQAARTEQVVATYPADLDLVPGGFDWVGDPRGPRHLLHPDLTVLLSTSGSTGSPKLVRLSRENLRANARGIVAALGLTADDRGITSLPLHYCYGLSVLHAHLVAGASLVIDDGSPVEPEFWSTVRERGVTNVALVPHSAQWLADSALLDSGFPDLRMLTQAGGRLPARSISQLAAAASSTGCEVRVMYGQTESTARITIGPPGCAERHPDSVGRAVPGTGLRLDLSVPEADGPGVGELVVTGPSVMLGYAEHADDLALGRMQHELRTGDLATIDDHGFVRIVGRRRNFAKLMGLRVDLDRLEQLLGEQGHEVVVTGDDTGLRIAVNPAVHDDPGRASRVRRDAAAASGVGPAVIDVAVMPMPLLDNGKVDRIAADALVRAATLDSCRETRRSVDSGGEAVTVTDVAGVLASVLAVDSLDPDRSFVEQGGDSLTHVAATTRLGALVGDLPSDWHHRPLRELAAPEHRTSHRVETNVVLRALTVLMICFSHTRVIDAAGGAHVLLAIAGWNAARFGLSLEGARQRLQATLRSVVGVWLPTAAAAIVGMVASDRYGWANVFLLNWLFGGLDDTRVELWFVDSLVACLVVMTVLCAVPPIARARRADPWRVHVVIAALALVPRFVAHAISDAPVGGVPHTVFFIFAVGAAISHAATVQRRLVSLTVLAVGIVTYFPDPQRNLTILAGVCLLAFVRDVPVPRRLVSTVVVIASASLYIYVFQFQIFQLVPRWEPGVVPGIARSLAAVVGGCLLWWLADPFVTRLRSLVRLDGSPSTARDR
ncbi:AMP-binding protein [Aestuariimicrobium kwangyangense]|uniref:AMP-binding protein n=1 Tax=Aestuariimicrobium kwangyangense TaxID=396389 RepID=UPI0003B56D58|nr:AMP-binding protein [Aestuariimicrobium kwangyangense]